MISNQSIDLSLLQYSFLGDLFMVADDPFGRFGPNINEFLRVNQNAKKSQAKQPPQPLMANMKPSGLMQSELMKPNGYFGYHSGTFISNSQPTGSKQFRFLPFRLTPTPSMLTNQSGKNSRFKDFTPSSETTMPPQSPSKFPPNYKNKNGASNNQARMLVRFTLRSILTV